MDRALFTLPDRNTVSGSLTPSYPPRRTALIYKNTVVIIHNTTCQIPLIIQNKKTFPSSFKDHVYSHLTVFQTMKEITKYDTFAKIGCSLMQGENSAACIALVGPIGALRIIEHQRANHLSPVVETVELM